MFVTFGKHQASTAKSVDRMRLSHGKVNTFEVFFIRCRLKQRTCREEMQEKSLRTQREEARNRVPHGGGVAELEMADRFTDADRVHGGVLRVLLPARGGSALPADAFRCVPHCALHAHAHAVRALRP